MGVSDSGICRPDLKQKLDHVSRRNGMSIADVLEIVIEEYFDLKD